MRDLVVVLHDTVRNAIHFCSTELQGDDRWFAFSGSSVGLFARVESIMVRNRIANNVTAVTYLRTSGSTVEYSVVFNKLAASPSRLAHGGHPHVPSTF